MLRNVICCFALKVFGALRFISWKYTFKRLNEEYEIAKKKQQALDNLYASGKISQGIKDSFNIEISAAIVAIEKQQKDLVEGMQVKTQDLENQLKTLETLLASYEIQHVAGEIEDDIYEREISLLTTGLETTKNELNTIKQVTYQLTTPATTAIPEIVAPTIQQVAAPLIEEPAPAPLTVESPTIEAVAEPAPIEMAPIETAPVEIPVEAAKAEEAPAQVETPTVEAAPIETAPIETTPVETIAAPIETAPVIETPVETAPAIEVAPIEVPVEAAPVETPIVEVAPVEAAPVEIAEPEVHEVTVIAPEIATTEPAIVEPAIEEPAINVEAAFVEVAPVVEEAAVEVVEVPSEIVEVVKEPEVEAAIDAFEVAPMVAEVETTLDKMMAPEVEPVIASVILEEVQVPAHPLEAPQAAQTETVPEQSAEETAATTEDSNKSE